MMEGSCKNCRFRGWARACRRYPPVVVYESGVFGSTKSEWPKVEDGDVCGEYQPKPPL